MAWVDLQSDLDEMFRRLVVGEVSKDSFIAGRKKDSAYYERRRRWMREYRARNPEYRERCRLLEKQRRARLKSDPEWRAREKERDRVRRSNRVQ